LQAEVSKRFYSSKANGSNVRDVFAAKNTVQACTGLIPAILDLVFWNRFDSDISYVSNINTHNQSDIQYRHSVLTLIDFIAINIDNFEARRFSPFAGL
jgi:hypothetical protein